MQNKKGFTLIELMIVVAIVAILAMIAVPMYQKYIERSRNTASQNMLQQISLAEIASQVDTVSNKGTGASTGYLFVGPATSASDDNVKLLMTFGFRPDPNVGFAILEPSSEDGFVAYACHVAKNSQMYVYDNVSGGGVQLYVDTKSYGGVAAPAQLYVYSLVAGVSKATLDGAPKKLGITNGKSNGKPV